jgi:hypothetical protein
MAPDDASELEFYRSVEDLFAALRGVPHVLSPKDFHLLRTWWREDVPLAAIRTGVTEVFARRRERGEAEPVVSLSYCRHAVEAHARRIAEMRIGAVNEDDASVSSNQVSIRRLAGDLLEAAEKNRPRRPRAAAVIERISHEVGCAVEIDRPIIEEHLFALETSLLVDCLDALEDDDRRRLEERARIDAERVAVSPDARDRTFQALRDRMLRDLLQLPRLEIVG